MASCIFLLFIIFTYPRQGELTINVTGTDLESRRMDMIINIITLNYKKNGWSTILTFGNFSNQFYCKLQNSSYPFAIITSLGDEDHYIEDVVPYYSNTIIFNLLDDNEYMDTMIKLMQSPYWHPHANIILYYHLKHNASIPKLFFSFWYNRAINAIIIQYDDNQLLISHYTPYTSDDYKLDYLYGCWTSRKLGMPISSLEEGFFCEPECDNVSLTSKIRANNLGTCIGFSTIAISYGDSRYLDTLQLFEDKSKDLHGFIFRAYVREHPPFLYAKIYFNGSYVLDSRDGNIWNLMSKLMNFRIDLSPSLQGMNEPFNFELAIKQLFGLAFRNVDLFLGPVYLFDVVVVQVDYSFAYRDSGVCIMSSRAGFETTLFNVQWSHAHITNIIQYNLCFFSIWIVFSLYQMAEKRRFSFNQIGKDLLNTCRNVLLIPLHSPPKGQSFRIFLTITIWCFFVLNFATQASIVSFLTAAKRGKDVDTFDEIIDKGYPIYGMASPDIILPDTEEKFNIINSRLVATQNPFECIKNLTLNSRRFCLIDCSVGRYLARNELNEKGEQFLHIAEEDKIHSHYLTIFLAKHSPLTERFDQNLMRFLEAGLISKWEKYRYAVLKEDAMTKPLRMEDLKNLFHVYCASLGFIIMIFLLELIINNFKTILNFFFQEYKNYKVNKLFRRGR